MVVYEFMDVGSFIRRDAEDVAARYAFFWVVLLAYLRFEVINLFSEVMDLSEGACCLQRSVRYNRDLASGAHQCLGCGTDDCHIAGMLFCGIQGDSAGSFGAVGLN